MRLTKTYSLLIILLLCPGTGRTFLGMASTDPGAGAAAPDQEESGNMDPAACYTEQRRLEEGVDPFAKLPGEEDTEYNPDLLDVSMEDTGKDGGSGDGTNLKEGVPVTTDTSTDPNEGVLTATNPNPTVGEQSRQVSGSQSTPDTLHLNYLEKNKCRLYLATKQNSTRPTIPNLTGGGGGLAGL
jgi:hypothetical protein